MFRPARPTTRNTTVVYAAIAASDRGRSFLREYASRIRRPETQSLINTIARLEAATLESAPPQLPPALVRGLVDLAAVIEQVEAVLATSGSAAADDLFAAERIQDIAMALRQRDVDAALCDALEASSREVGDAIVRSNAAAARAVSAASQLRDLARPVKDLISLAVAVAGPPLHRKIGLQLAKCGMTATPNRPMLPGEELLGLRR